MGEKTALPYNQGKMLTYDAAVILEAIAADLRQRNLTITGETGSERIDVPADAKLEISYKQKVRPEKRKQKLSIELSWKELPAEEAAPASDTETTDPKPSHSATELCKAVEPAPEDTEESSPAPDVA